MRRTDLHNEEQKQVRIGDTEGGGKGKSERKSKGQAIGTLRTRPVSSDLSEPSKSPILEPPRRGDPNGLRDGLAQR